jgi:hypothetical protein
LIRSSSRSSEIPFMLMSCLWRTPETPETPEGAAQTARLLELAIDGFRP